MLTEETEYGLNIEHCQGLGILDGDRNNIPPPRNVEQKCSGK